MYVIGFSKEFKNLKNKHVIEKMLIGFSKELKNLENKINMVLGKKNHVEKLKNWTVVQRTSIFPLERCVNQH